MLVGIHVLTELLGVVHLKTFGNGERMGQFELPIHSIELYRLTPMLAVGRVASISRFDESSVLLLCSRA